MSYHTEVRATTLFSMQKFVCSRVWQRADVCKVKIPSLYIFPFRKYLFSVGRGRACASWRQAEKAAAAARSVVVRRRCRIMPLCLAARTANALHAANAPAVRRWRHTRFAFVTPCRQSPFGSDFLHFISALATATLAALQRVRLSGLLRHLRVKMGGP